MGQIEHSATTLLVSIPGLITLVSSQPLPNIFRGINPYSTRLITMYSTFPSRVFSTNDPRELTNPFLFLFLLAPCPDC